MKKNRLSTTSSILLVIASLLIVVSLFFPWWRLDFYAPQYPEGLDITVYPNHLEGDLSNINGLNHYIGMKQFSESDFPELQFLPYIIGGLALLILIGAIIRKKIYLYTLIGIFIVGGIIGVFHLMNSLNAYSLNLDPMAPIEMEGFTIPIVGKNIIANFTTYSNLGTGIYFAIAAFINLIDSTLEGSKEMKKLTPLFFLVFLILITLPRVSMASETLQSTIDSLEDGAVLHLENKTYVGNIVINKPIEIIGEKDTIIKGDGTGQCNIH